jgi:Kinesin motor domain
VPGQAGGERILRSKFNLVDLAGSEKWDIRQEMGDDRVNELTSINVSLYTLGR